MVSNRAGMRALLAALLVALGALAAPADALPVTCGPRQAQLGEWPQWKRWLWAGGMLLTPAQLIGRLVLSIAPRPALWRDFVLGLPLIVAAQCTGALSEARGYVMGFGQSRDDFLEMERYAKRVV